MKLRSFLSKNLVVIIVVPALIGAHYGWYKLQQVDELVSPVDRQRSPLAKVKK